MVLITSFCVHSEEMQLFCNDNGSKQFATLQVEDQYNSVINSFNGLNYGQQASKWIIRMLDQYERDVLPCINKTLIDFKLDNLRKVYRDCTIDILQDIFYYLINFNFLYEEEKQLYITILYGKINEYILKYRVIDYPVAKAVSILSLLGYSFPENDGFSLKAFYEEKLSVKDLQIADMDDYVILDSPLAEYITD